MTSVSATAPNVLRASLAGVILATAAVSAHADDVIYDSVPDPLPDNLLSLGYQATQTAEFGDHIAFGGIERLLSTQRVLVRHDDPMV